MNIRKLLSAARAPVELLYDRVATIKRYEEYEKENGSTSQKWVTKHEDVPCRLSTEGTQTLNNSLQEESNRIQYDAKLLLSPEVDILPGDEITVELFEDDKLILTDEFESAKKPFLYVTHQEVLLTLKDHA
ncbi:hypothetical protein [Bacillus ndiopicus]|uniref:hypothetical protein n=1 Tax=Bacillus ndiopicus TaxID=1347368 RepID=UPI0005A90DBE|nr:hypothetical protein [Bacillus ndiopicus]